MNSITVKNIISNPISIRKFEFWAATTIFVFSVFFLSTSSESPNRYLFDEARIPFNYYEDYHFPQLFKYITFYLAFLLFNFVIVPKLIKKQSLFLNIFLIVLIFVTVGLVFGIADTYAKNYLFNRYNDEQQTYNVIFQGSFRFALWLLLMFGIYNVIKSVTLYLLSNSDAIQSKYRILTRDGLAAFVFWMLSVFLLLITNAEGELVAGWAVVGFSGILLYCYSFYSLIPLSLSKKKPFWSYAVRSALILALSFLPVSFILLLLLHNEETAFGVGFFNTVFQLFITVPITWLLFKRQLKGNQELAVLKTELGASNASLDFLRSQINPHFLFNALNTLYGTALQENSERTAQGIQMLGDMMRFMLHENMQQKILISREIDYMRNYIDLQMLRTSTSPNIAIETEIEDVVENKFIAPMLLIPFVENAFKHGISLKNKSWIRITLHYKQNKLYFDVYNSTQPKSEMDTEKDKSGVGLKNVKQRLNLLYPNRHELIIRETAQEFFVHLTLDI